MEDNKVDDDDDDDDDGDGGGGGDDVENDYVEEDRSQDL